MHELGIVMHVIEQVEKVAQDNDVDKLKFIKERIFWKFF